MKPEPDDPVGANPEPRPEDHDDVSGRDESGAKPNTGPFTGGYYWMPIPAQGGIAWSVVTCHDLGCDADAGHDAELWPRLLGPLAAAWGRDARFLSRKLALCYTGLPRGRVTEPDQTFLVLHGRDSPVPTWEVMVIESFRLFGWKVKFLFDEHETQIRGHRPAVGAVLGFRLGGEAG